MGQQGQTIRCCATFIGFRANVGFSDSGLTIDAGECILVA